MRKLVAASVALLLAGGGSAIGQSAAGQQPTAGAALASSAADEAYRASCEPKADKALCACLIAVADAEIADPQERGIFFAYTIGDFEKARAERALFEAEKNIALNRKLQKAEAAVHEQCDRLRPQQPAPTGQPAQPAPSPY